MPRAERAGAIERVGELLRGQVRQLAFLPSGELLIVAGGRVERVNPDTLERIDTWLEDQPLTQLHVLADGRIFVHWDKSVALARYGEPPVTLLEREESMSGVAVTPDGRTIVCPTSEGVALFDAQGAQTRALKAPPMRYPSGGYVAVSPSGRHVARWDNSEGFLWCDGEVVTHLVRGTRSGEPFEEIQPRTFKEVVFLSDERLVASDHHVWGWDLRAMERGRDLGRDHDGSLVFAGGRLIAADGYGGYVELDPESLETRATVGAQSHHYGSQGHAARASASATHVATHAPSYGTVHVSGPGGTVSRGGHLQSLEELTVSRDGQRLALMGDFRERGYAIDRRRDEIRDVVTDEGIQGLAVSDDGTQLVFASGTNLRPRVVHVVDFEGGEATATHKGMPWSRGTLGFGGRLYAHSAYNLRDNGWVGIYELGSKRAIAKLKTFPWRFDVSRDGSTAVVAGSWRKKDGATVYDLSKKGKARETLPKATEVALGQSGDTLAYLQSGKRPTLVVRRGSESVQLKLDDDERVFAFAEDDSLLFVSGEQGIDARRTDTGELVAQLPCPGGNERLVARGGLLFALGKDALVRVYGVPGELPAVAADAPDPVELEAEAPEVLPVTRSWPIASSAVQETTLELGGRTLTLRVSDEGPSLFDAEDRPLKSLRKRKSDDAERFAEAKRIWNEARKARKRGLEGPGSRSAGLVRELQEALATGRSVTPDELRAMQAHGGFERTLWEPRSGTGMRVGILGGELISVAGDAATLDEGARYRLAHPVRLGPEQRSGWRARLGGTEQLERPIHRARGSTSTSAVPVETDWAKTQNKMLVRLLGQRGFRRHLDNGHADFAITLLAPELGAVVLVALDAEHGISELSFQRWDGTRDGGEALPFHEVDPQLFSEAWFAVIYAYRYDA